MRRDIHLKIKWANHHFRNFQNTLNAFLRSDPCGITPEREPNTHSVFYRVSNDVVVPDDLALIAGDVLQNLRSALDYLACSLVSANGGKVTRQTSFPIVENVPSTPREERTFARKIHGMREEAKDLIRACLPYKGGDDVLWRLHELNRRDKHRLLFTVGGFVDNWNISEHIARTNPPLDVLERMGRAYISDDTWTHVRKVSFPLKAGDVLFVDFPNAPVNEKIKFGVQVAINEPGICDAEPLIAVLDASIRRVLQVVKRFDGMY